MSVTLLQGILIWLDGWIMGLVTVGLAAQFIDTFWMTKALTNRGTRKGEEGETNG